MKRFFLFIILSFSVFIQLAAQNQLNSYNTSWTTVIPGKVLCEPVLTSYGFVLNSDAKSITAFSEKGKLFWEKTVSSKDAKIFGLPEDFILIYENSSRKIALINPSGYKIWENQLESDLISVFSGRDGRFFVKGRNFISCYGISGIRKWNLKTEELNSLNFQELPDGSLIAFYSKLQNDKTKGFRISPFGEILEEITFNGQIISAQSCKKGVLLTFSDGTPGFFSLSSENLCENKWILQKIKASSSDKKQVEKSVFVVNDNKTDVIYVLPYKNFVELYKINLENGTALSNYSVQNIKGFELSELNYSDNEFLICDDSHGYLIDDCGKEIFACEFQPQNKFKWNYIFLTKSDELVFCGTNWTLNSYKLNQKYNSIHKKGDCKYDSYFKVSVDEYTFALMDKLDSDFASQQRVNALYKGDYGSNEQKWAFELEEYCAGLSLDLYSENGNSRKEKTVFDLDNSGTEKMLLQLGAFSDDQFNSYAASFLCKVNNKALLGALLNGIIKNGYDPEQKMLNALEKAAEQTNYKDETSLKKICDAVYSICLFMGKPAFNSKGKDILSKFLFPSYMTSTRAYARETLKKIGSLEL